MTNLSTADAVRTPAPDPAVEAFLATWDGIQGDLLLVIVVAERLTCGEVEALCGLFEYFKRPQAAQQWRDVHAALDEPSRHAHYRPDEDA